VGVCGVIMKDVDVDKLSLELIQARRWLLSVSKNLEYLTPEERNQYEFALAWVKLQQKVLDEMEGWDS